MSTPVNPDGIPGANLNPDGIVEAATAIRKVATTIDTKTSEIDTDWAGLSTVYSAPESHDVLILMKQVATDGDASSKALSTVADALDKFAEDVRPIKKTLDELRVRAQTFVKDQVNDTDRWIPWDQDLGAVNDNNDIINKVNDQVEALMVAERTCANSIRALYGAQALHAITTENDPLGYGFDDLSGAKELPWGTPTDHLEGCVGQTATFVFKDFLWEGVIVGGAWGTVQGLGTLVLGYNPNDGSWLQPSTYGAAWGQVGHIAAGSFVYGNPVTLTALLVDRGMRASGNKGFLDQATVNFTNDCDQSLIGAGKGMIAWDKWSTDPGTAAGESVFNLGTLLIPGGGEAVAGVKGLGGAAKILGTTGKVLEVLDAGAWAAKGAGALGGATVKGLAHAFEGLDLGKLSSTVPDLRLDDLTNKASDADLPSYKPGSDVPESKFPDENYSGSTGDAGRASDSPSPHSDADPDAPHTGDDPANPHGNGDSGTPHADTTTSLPDSSASTPHDGDATTPHSDHDTGTAHSDTDSATPHTEHDSAPHEGDAHAPHEGDLASGHGHGDSPDGPGTHPTDGMHDASDVIAAENRPEVHQTADPENPGFDTDGHRMLDDRGDGRLHYQLDPEHTFRDVNERLHDSHGFAVDPYTGHRFSYDDLADQGRAATHTMQDPSSWADQVADWSRTREKPQAILNEIRSRAEDMGIDPTGKTPKQIAAEAQKLADKGAFGTEEALLTRDMARDYDTARQSLNLRSETMGESAALDVARGRGDTVVIQGPAGANRLDVVSLGHGPDGYSLHVFEAKGGDSPSLGGRNTAGRSYAQQGSATYLADLVSGRNTDPRLTELVHQWQTDPAYADLVKHLHSDGIPVTYDLVNARTNGKVRISQFGLGETFRLRLGPHGLEVTR